VKLQTLTEEKLAQIVEARRESYSFVDKIEGGEANESDVDGDNSQMKRKMTLVRIQTKHNEKVEKINLKNCPPYWMLDETSLKLQGLSDCRIEVTKKLQTKAVFVTQIILIVLYAAILLITFIYHEVKFDDLVTEYSLPVVQPHESLLLQVCFKIELFLLVLFIIDQLVHTVGYGRIFLRSLHTIAAWVFICANEALLVLFWIDARRVQSLFCSKLVLACALLFVLIETVRVKV